MESPTANTPNEAFYSRALSRISRIMLVLAPLAGMGAWLFFGKLMALGFLCGAAIAWLNFHWLKRIVSALADRATQSEVPQSSSGVVARFLFRYLLVALGAYVMIKSSPGSIFGLLAGLFVPVAAILCEAGYEIYVSLSRQNTT